MPRRCSVSAWLGPFHALYGQSGDLLRSNAPLGNNKTRADARASFSVGRRPCPWWALQTPPYVGTRALFLMLPVGPRACYHARERAYNRAPCLRSIACAAVPELPDLAILADALDDGAGRPRHAGATTPQSLVSARHARRARPRSTGSCLIESARRGKFLVFAVRARPDRLQPDAHRPARVSPSPEPSRGRNTAASSSRFVARPRLLAERARTDRPVHDWPGDADWLPRRDLRRRDALPRRDAHGQDLPDAGRRHAARRRLGGAGAGRGRSGADARRLAGADRPSTAAS